MHARIKDICKIGSCEICLQVLEVESQTSAYFFHLLGADISLKDFNNKKAFDLASNLNIRKLLATEVEHLYLAVCEGDMAEMEKLLKSSDVNIEFNEGLTPLHVAVQGNYLELVKYLVKHGADVNSQVRFDSLKTVIKDIFTYLSNRKDGTLCENR